MSKYSKNLDQVWSSRLATFEEFSTIMTKLRYNDGKQDQLVTQAYDMVRNGERAITRDQVLIVVLGIENAYDATRMSNFTIQLDDKPLQLDRNFEKFHRRLKPLLDVKFYLDFYYNKKMKE